ncbi:type II toxin-antitoxin system RelE/ParE family toxin [Campylobacter ureolyticus]|uniref:type II toxin-antitoxin system RelE/ParE family toxin n=1 Tax=Campylobacter ureolyticus TaxID=827 RepID=UPI0022B41948|nr:type II toxin-antitoxin system RelE/ParE family toxin [Campylobacter ureolyticus]MCZ6133665.1 type II toxin-antitoxin system RelE/ParE family toxin [Campylobacter ureolyticus]
MIILTERFKSELKNIIDFISDDSILRAVAFRDELLDKIYLLPNYPRIYRKSIKFNDENIRDFIFKGYVIPYLIDDDKIVILGIYKRNLWNK